MKLKLLIAFALLLTGTFFFLKQNAPMPPASEENVFKDSVNTMLPIDEIEYVEIDNYYNKANRRLSEKELAELVSLLKASEFQKGLLLKPGHIDLSFKLKNGSIISSYAKGNVLCFYAVGQKIHGTFQLPPKFNFDNYE